MKRPIGIDLFAGAGGMSLGFESAGFDIVAAVELDPVHAATHKFNFPNCATLPRSVSELSAKDIRRAAGIGNAAVDVVFGGAPCQGFSLIGQRALNDPRNKLVREFVRLVRELKPRYFVFENVKGLTQGKQRKILSEIIEEFIEAGYTVCEPWKVLNASAFRVPQHRERLILIGYRNKAPRPNYPEPITQGVNKANGNLFAGPSCEDALSDLPNADNFPELNLTDEVITESWGKPSAYARRLRCLDNDSFAHGYPRVWNPKKLTSSLRTEHTEISRRRFSETPLGTVEPISRFYKLSPDGISNTLRAGTDSARGAFTSPRPIHYKWPRCITVREMARLHGFPDWFRFHETKWHGARQIGNAVPPPLAEAVATEIIKAMNLKPMKPKLALELGDETLLRLDLSQAAKYWGVQNPIGRRNKKSGAKKRKQFEIELTRVKSPSQTYSAPLSQS